MDQTNDIDAIVDELRADAVSSAPKEACMEEIKKLNDENVSDYVYQKTAQVIEMGLGAINVLKDSVVSGQDPKEIAALAALINSVTKATDSLNKINLQTKQHKNNLEVAKVEANGSKANLLPQTTNVLIATRDEIMTKLFDKGSKKDKMELIEGDFTKDSE
jgi:phenylalanyl-tRNA synthetase alpha subunit